MTLKDFIGQENVKKNLALLIDAAKMGRDLPHIAIYGPAGSGKTMLAQIIAEEVGAELIYINGAAITSPIVFRQPIAKAVTATGKFKKYVIMIDECHAIPKKIQNNLLSVLEKPAILCTPVERKLQLPNGKYLQRGQILKEKLPDNVSFICCTTDKGQLTDAMESRLHPIHLQDYEVGDKELVVQNILGKYKITLQKDDLILISNTSKSMRNLTKICERIVDYAVGQSNLNLTHQDILKVLDILGLDLNGCDINDRKYLGYVREHAPVSLSNIARYLNVPEKDVKEKIEPFLIRKEWITITAKGRTLTQDGFKTVFKENTYDTLNEIMDIFNYES